MEHKTLGQRVAESEAYKQMKASGRRESDRIEVESFHSSEAKELTTTEAGGGALITPTRVPGVVAPPERRLFLRDLIPSTRSNGVVEYVEETGFTNAAAPVAEGAVKPPSDLTFELVQLSSKVIAHTMTASRQVLSDASLLRSYVDGRMIYGIKYEEEGQLLYGDGLGENLTGLLTHDSRQTYTESTDGQVGDTKLHSIRRSITLVSLAEYAASGVALHPTDKEEIDLLQGGDDHFLHLDVSAGNIPAYFRVPIVETSAIIQGEAAVGAFNLAARIHDVWDAFVRLFEQHADYAARNKVLLVGEERLALANERPEAIVHVEFDGPPAA